MVIQSIPIRPLTAPRQTALLLLLLVVLPGTAAHAQFLPRCDSHRVIRMDYDNTGGEKGVSIFHYRRDGALGSGLWTLTDHSRYSANYYVHDDAGRVVEKYREFSDALTSTETYTYDAAGRRVSETYVRSDGRAGTASYRWDDENRLSASDLDNYKGWLSGHIEYRYDGDRHDGAIITRDGETIGTIAYVHDDAGRLVEEVWDFGGRWSQTFGYVYEPIPTQIHSASSPLMIMNPRYRIVAEEYDYNGEGGGPSTYTYDDEGRLLTKVFERADGLRTETTYAYDDRGNLLSSHRSYHDGRSADFTYIYDDALRLTGKTFRRSDGAEGYERYTYDRLGRLETAVYRNMDFWLNGVITFSYDGWGRLAAGHFIGEDGFDAELKIETDDHRNVLTVHWVLGFGKTQTYSFAYGAVPNR